MGKAGAAYRFEGEDCRLAELGRALWSLNVWSLKDDCLLRTAGVGKESHLMPVKSVGSTEGNNFVPLDESLWNFLRIIPSSALLVSVRSFSGSCRELV